MGFDSVGVGPGGALVTVVVDEDDLAKEAAVAWPVALVCFAAVFVGFAVAFAAANDVAAITSAAAYDVVVAVVGDIETADVFGSYGWFVFDCGFEMYSEFAYVAVDSFADDCAVDFELDLVAEIDGLLAVAAFVAVVAADFDVAEFAVDVVEFAVAVVEFVVGAVVVGFDVAAVDYFAVEAGAEIVVDYCLRKNLTDSAVNAPDGTVFEAAVAVH